MALRGSADETFVEGDVGAQAGDLLVAFGQRALQFGVGLAADLVGTPQGGGFLLQHVDARGLAAQQLGGIRRLRPERAPQAPAAEGQCGEDQQGEGHPRMTPAGGGTRRCEKLHGAISHRF